MQRRDDGGLGTQLVGDRIIVNHRCVSVTKLLGEGGFSYVYLVKEISDGSTVAAPLQSAQSEGAAPSKAVSNGSSGKSGGGNLVLKVTSIHSRQQRDIAEKEAKLLSRLSHPSIIKMYDSCLRSAPPTGVGIVAGIVGASKDKDPTAALSSKDRVQHLILMEYCEGGHALDVCANFAASGQRFDLSSLIIAFGQICNAVSYLHAQRPPIVHRDLKPVNFLVKNGAYKLCDFGSAVFGHVELKTHKAKMEAEEVIQKTTTQMFRAPEMVDIYMAKKLTQSTDVWALGCCLYSLAFLQNCFEEGSNLAILSRNYKIPEDNPYGDGLVELIDRMLTVDSKARADMTEVILCLSAIYSGRPLPTRKKSPKNKKNEGVEGSEAILEEKTERVGVYRTDGQGYRKPKADEHKKPVEAKKLNPNSAAARRIRAAQIGDSPGLSPAPVVSPVTNSMVDSLQFSTDFADAFDMSTNAPPINEDLAFDTTDNPFAGVKDERKCSVVSETIFPTFEESIEVTQGSHCFVPFSSNAVWGGEQSAQESPGFSTTSPFPTFSPDDDSARIENGLESDGHEVTIDPLIMAPPLGDSPSPTDKEKNKQRRRRSHGPTTPTITKKEGSKQKEEKPKPRSSQKGMLLPST